MIYIAETLLKIKAVSLSPKEPFTWASGIKSPIYCDNRLLMSHPQEWTTVIEALAAIIKEKYPETEYIMGTATAGIPHAAALARKLELPMGFVRSKAKDHGKAKQIEGEIMKGAKTLVIEDLFSTGGSSIEAAKVCRDEGFDVLGILSIFTYGLDRCEKNFKDAGFAHDSATNLTELLDLSIDQGDISPEEKKEILAWKETL